MSLKHERWKFTLDLAKLVLYINQCCGARYSCAINEVKRPQSEADLNAQQGDGIKNSLHLEGLAGDVLIYKDGEYLENTEDYKFAGDYWKGLDSQNAWGGDNRKPDGNHFSRSYQGRK